MFSFKGFVVLALTFSSTYVELIFVYGTMWCEVGVQCHSFACGNPVLLGPSVEENISSPLCNLGTFVEDQLTMYMWV